MSFKILYVAATSTEADILKNISGIVSVSGGYSIGDTLISVLVTGVGSISTAWAMKQWLSVNEKPDLALNAGIAGSYKDEFVIGDVVMPISDCFADAGIEDGDNFLTVHEAGLTGSETFPFRDGFLITDSGYCNKTKSLIRPVKAITVNTSTGSEITRERLFKKFNPDIETMEGATFFYICTWEKIPFLAIRAISNRVEARNKSKWNIALALANLSEKLNEVLVTLE
jgi:futalosine hydrolase